MDSVRQGGKKAQCISVFGKCKGVQFVGCDVYGSGMR